MWWVVYKELPFVHWFCFFLREELVTHINKYPKQNTWELRVLVKKNKIKANTGNLRAYDLILIRERTGLWAQASFRILPSPSRIGTVPHHRKVCLLLRTLGWGHNATFHCQLLSFFIFDNWSWSKYNIICKKVKNKMTTEKTFFLGVRNIIVFLVWF